MVRHPQFNRGSRDKLSGFEIKYAGATDLYSFLESGSFYMVEMLFDARGFRPRSLRLALMAELRTVFFVQIASSFARQRTFQEELDLLI